MSLAQPAQKLYKLLAQALLLLVGIAQSNNSASDRGGRGKPAVLPAGFKRIPQFKNYRSNSCKKAL